MELVSIIIPIYNVEKYVHRCVDSVINQTYRNLEIILVDDGSPDDCGKICDEYAKKDNRIKAIHKENGGLSDARNYGIESATGEWLFFLDSDDWIHPQTIEKLYDAAIKNDVSVSICNYSQTEEESPAVDIYKNAELWTPKDLYLKHHVTATIACAKLYRNYCFKNIRYPVGKIHEDEFITYKILFAQEKIAFINQPYYAYFMNNEGIMKSVWKPQRLVRFDAVEDQISFFKFKCDDELVLFSENLYLWLLVSEHKKAVCCGFVTEGKLIACKAILFALKSPQKIFVPDNIWVLEYFFPRSMRVYSFVKSGLNKLFRR